MPLFHAYIFGGCIYNLTLFYLLALEVTNINKKFPRDRFLPLSRIAIKKEDSVTIPKDVFTSVLGIVHLSYLKIFKFFVYDMKKYLYSLVKSLNPIFYKTFGNFIQCCPIVTLYYSYQLYTTVIISKFEWN